MDVTETMEPKLRDQNLPLKSSPKLRDHNHPLKLRGMNPPLKTASRQGLLELITIMDMNPALRSSNYERLLEMLQRLVNKRAT